MINIFPDLTVTRIDVKSNLLKVFASVEMPNSSMALDWLAPEDFAPFVNCNFLMFIESAERLRDFSPPTFNNSPFFESAFLSLQDPFTRVANLQRFDRTQEMLLYLHDAYSIEKVNMADLRDLQSASSLGVSVTQDDFMNKLYFEVDFELMRPIDLKQLTQFVQNNFSINLLYYIHVDYEGIEENYSITTGTTEIRRLGSPAKRAPVFFYDKAADKFSTSDPNLVSIQIKQEGQKPFEGYFGLPSVLESMDEGVSGLPDAGNPDPISWRSRLNYASIYAKSGMGVPTDIEKNLSDAAKKKMALKSAQDHSSILSHYIQWNSRRKTISQHRGFDPTSGNFRALNNALYTGTENNVDAYSSLFVFDIIKALTYMSPMGFILDKDISKLTETQRFTMLGRVIDNSKIRSLKITRKKLENIPSSCNLAGVSDYDIEHTQSDKFILTSEGVNLNGVSEILEKQTSEFVIKPHYFRNLSLTADSENFFYSHAVKFHDKGLYHYGKEGDKYKYLIEVAITDGIPILIKTYLEEFKEYKRHISSLISEAWSKPQTWSSTPENQAAPSNYDPVKNQWSEQIKARPFSELKSSISLYCIVMALLGIDNPNQSELENSVLPSKNASLDSLMIYYNSFLNAEKVLYSIYDKSTDADEGLGSEVVGTNSRVPKGERTNIIDIRLMTKDPVIVENKEGFIADFRYFSQQSTQNLRKPAAVCLEVYHKNTGLFDDKRERKVSSPIIFQHEKGEPSVQPEIIPKIPQYDSFIDYLARKKKKIPFNTVDNNFIPRHEGVLLRANPDWPIKISLYQRSTANVANYLPGATFELPSIKKSFRSTASRNFSDGDGFESLAYSTLEEALFVGFNQPSDFERYVTELGNTGPESADMLAGLSLTGVGFSSLSVILEIMKTIDSYQEEYEAFSEAPKQPLKKEEFLNKYTPNVSTLKGINNKGEIYDIGIDNNIGEALLVYVDTNDPKYKKIEFTIVNSIKYGGE